MRFLRAFLQGLFCSGVAVAQTEEGLPLKGDFAFHDRVSLSKYLERENQLLLVGDKTLVRIDVGSGKTLESQPTNFPWVTEHSYPDTYLWPPPLSQGLSNNQKCIETHSPE